MLERRNRLPSHVRRGSSRWAHTGPVSASASTPHRAKLVHHERLAAQAGALLPVDGRSATAHLINSAISSIGSASTASSIVATDQVQQRIARLPSSCPATAFEAGDPGSAALSAVWANAGRWSWRKPGRCSSWRSPRKRPPEVRCREGRDCSKAAGAGLGHWPAAIPRRDAILCDWAIIGSTSARL